MIVHRITVHYHVGKRARALELLKQSCKMAMDAGVFKVPPRIYTTRLSSETTVSDFEFDSFQDIDAGWQRFSEVPGMLELLTEFHTLRAGPMLGDFLESDPLQDT